MTDTTAPPAIAALRVTKTYGSGATSVTALADVTLQVSPGTWLAVMGPSGSGKSTLLHCLAGLERADAGRVVLAGADITRASDRTLTRLRRTSIGFAFQNFNLVGSLTAAQNVALPLRLAGARPSRSRLRAALDEVGLGDRSRHRPAQLSGGQQQRVALARAIVTRPAVLFADEPTGALDSAASRSVLELLRRMTDRGQTVVMVTHDPAAAAAADRVVFLVDGGVADEVERPSAGAVAATLAGLERR